MNKKLRKILTLACSAVLLVCLSVGATVAYLTDTKTVTNTFTVGNVAIDLDETDVDLYGVKEGETRVKTNEYKLLPGHTYTKDPTVTVKAGSEESYIRMLVTITKMAAVKAAFGDDFLPQYFVEGWDGKVWETTGEIKVDVDGDSCTYEFRYYDTVTAAADEDTVLPALFTKIVVPGDVTNDEIAALEDMEIKVVAQAIQADGFDDAAAAWAAFDDAAAAE